MNKLFLGDNLEILKSIEDNSIDMVLTSPPYDDIRNYEESLIWNFEIFKKLANELKRVIKKGGVIVWIVNDKTEKGSETGTSFKQALFFKEIGLNLHDTMIYQKDNPPPVGGNKRYYSSFEYMFILSKGSPKTFNPIKRKRRNKWNDKRTQRYKNMTRDKNGNFIKKLVKINDIVKIGNIWKYVVSGGSTSSNKIAHKHPAIFPEKLAQDHILSWSKEGDVILDPMMGSGTTCFVAKELKRKFIGIEKVEKYFNISKQRLKN